MRRDSVARGVKHQFARLVWLSFLDPINDPPEELRGQGREVAIGVRPQLLKQPGAAQRALTLYEPQEADLHQFRMDGHLPTRGNRLKALPLNLIPHVEVVDLVGDPDVLNSKATSLIE